MSPGQGQGQGDAMLGPGSGLAAKASWKGDKDGDACAARRKVEALERPGKGWVKDS